MIYVILEHLDPKGPLLNFEARKQEEVDILKYRNVITTVEAESEGEALTYFSSITRFAVVYAANQLRSPPEDKRE